MENINISITTSDNILKNIDINLASPTHSADDKNPPELQILQLRIKKVHPSAVMPLYAKKGDAGFDLVAVEGASLAPSERVSLSTGLAFEIPDGYVGLIWDRSGLSHKKGLKVLGGVIDNSFRGEVKIGLLNTSKDPIEIMKGDKVAQMLIQKFETVEFKVSDDLSETERGDKWLGSSDKEEGIALNEIKEIKKDQNDQRPKSTSRW